MSAGSGGRERASRRALLIAWLAALAALLLAVAAIEPLHTAVADALSGDARSLRADLRELGLGGVAMVLALALVHAVIFYPAEILDAAAGFIYGFWLALPLMLVGWLLNGMVCHQVGRHAARPLLLRIAGEERLRRYERAVERGGVTLLIAMRLIPIVPFSLFSYAAGSAGVNLRTFAWTTVVGYLPLTAAFVYLGSRLEELSPRDPVLWVGAVAVLAMLLLTRWVMPRLRRDGAGRPLDISPDRVKSLDTMPPDVHGEER